ncbi:efflux RND transporter permease subunit [Leptospira jelokensis]|uniref:efflux RND transporter permease subunit n=1 Tax=Leptospira jelokensis TaxID=2484931 RepID=UPI0010911BEB|nr:efflux RND transporter permease subunit [Leptospira jelokensis]TGM05204.1 hypothetical protein EHQ79_04160 [Leptospira jelokensis]
MNFANFVIQRKSLLLTIFTFLFFLGILEFLIMPREEDPRLKERFGVLKMIYPGASVETIHRLVILPTEEALAEVPSIANLEIRVRPEVMIAEIRLNDQMGTEQEINDAWKRIEDTIKRTESKYPNGLLPWDLNRRVTEQEAILVSITGSEDILFLKSETESLKTDLMKINSVSKINRLADPEEEIEILITKQRLEEKGISLRLMMDWIQSNNHNIAPGALAIDGKKVMVQSDGWFRDLSTFSLFPIPLPGGQIVNFSELANVSKKPKFPVTEIMRANGKNALGLGIIAKKDINLISFGESIGNKIDEWQKNHPKVTVKIINSQPNYVKTRLRELGFNLVSGIFIVAFVLVVMMGLRMGILSAMIVPVIAIISLGIYGMFGGVLHQISIAAFVMALGLLIDNVIVILESIQEKIDEGQEILTSTIETIQHLSFPLLSATGTTLASFIPLLGSSGNSADFTRAIPIINMITLTVSFFFALLVTPILGMQVLRKNKPTKLSLYERVSEKIGIFIPFHAKKILFFVSILFLISIIGFLYLPKKFFPDADRDQLILDVRMPEGTDIFETNRLAYQIESWLSADKRLKSVIVFVGRSVPLFYYNLNQSRNSPNVAQFILNFKDIREKDSFKKDFQNILDQKLHMGNAVLLELKQGPPVKAPIEIRFFSEDHSDLEMANQRILKTLYEIPGIKDVRADLSIGIPVLHWQNDDATLTRYKTSRSEVTLSILAQTNGIPLGYYRAGEKPIPIKIRTSDTSNLSSDSIDKNYIFSTRTENVKLESVSHLAVVWEPAYLYKKNRQTGASIYAELENGYSAIEVTKLINQKLKFGSLPNSVQWEFGGEEAESGSANQSLVAVAPLGMMILISFLLFEFGSWKKVGVILLTVPLTMIGVVPGLLLSGKPFGFLSLLGIFALVGIVVNNGILLLDYMSNAIREGMPLSEAIQYSISKRIRPILLTTLTTVAGLFPLTITDATLWPPFAWTMISGLLGSTFLTLFVIPSATYLLFQTKTQTKEKSKKPKMIKNFFPFFLFIILLFSNLHQLSSEPLVLSWKDTVKLAEESPRVKLAWEEWKRKNLEKEKFNRAVYYPKLGLSIEHVDRNKTLFPNAAIPIVAGVNPSYWYSGIEVQQTLFDPANWFAVSKALDYSEESQKLLSFRAKETSQAEALLSFLTVHRVKVKRQNLTELKQNFSVRLGELRRLYAIGQVTESEIFRIEQAITQAKLSLDELSEKEKISILSLRRNLGIDEEITIGPLPAYEEISISEDESEIPERLELTAIRKKLLALQEKKKSIEYEALPKVIAKGNYIYLNNNQFSTDNWAQVSLGITMNPFDGGLRKVKEEETESEIRSTKEEFLDLIRALQIEKEDSLAMMKLKKQEVLTRQTNVNKSKFASKKEYERVKFGKTNINSWIDAEILYSEEKDRFEMSQLDLLERIIRFRSVMGICY